MFYSRFLPEIPLKQYLDTIKDEYRGIELGLDSYYARDITETPHLFNELTDLAAKYHLSFTVHAAFYRVCFSHPEKTLREAAKKEILRSFQIAETLGAKKITIHPSGFENLEHLAMPEEVERREEEALFSLCEKAGEAGLILCLENMPKQKYFPAYAWDLRRLVHLTSIMPRQSFGFTIDAGHALVSGIDINPYLPELAPFIEHFHLHDNDGSFDQHRFFLPAHETFWKEFWQTVKAIDYKGSFCIEVKDLAGQIEAVRKAKEWLK